MKKMSAPGTVTGRADLFLCALAVFVAAVAGELLQIRLIQTAQDLYPRARSIIALKECIAVTPAAISLSLQRGHSLPVCPLCNYKFSTAERPCQALFRLSAGRSAVYHARPAAQDRPGGTGTDGNYFGGLNIHYFEIFPIFSLANEENIGKNIVPVENRGIFFGKTDKGYLYISRRYGMMLLVAQYPSQSAPVSKKGLKILLRAYR